MRSVRIATWTSGDPVSPLPCACSLMSAPLRSAVIDIVSLLFVAKVETPDDLEAVGRGFDESDRSSLQHRHAKPRLRGDPEQLLSMTEQLGLIGGDGEGRDVVQRRLKRNNRPIELPRLSGLAQKVQRNGPFEREGAGAGTPQIGYVAQRSKRASDVARE